MALAYILLPDVTSGVSEIKNNNYAYYMLGIIVYTLLSNQCILTLHFEVETIVKKEVKMCQSCQQCVRISMVKN